MYRTISIFVGFVMSASLWASVGDDLDRGVPLMEVTEKARDDGMSPMEVTTALIDAGQTASRSVYAVATTWGDCDATMQTVGQASSLRPDEVEAIITSAAGLKNCGCSGQSMWAKARMDTRLRPESYIQPVELSQSCSCITAAVEAAVSAAPQKSDIIVRAAVDAGQRLMAPLADSIGERDVGEVLGNARRVNPNSQVLTRKPQVCKTDTDDTDEFEPADEWEIKATTDYSDLGRHVVDCDDDGDVDEDHENFNELMISEVLTDGSGGTYVEIFNGTGSDVDLDLGAYKITNYYQGVDSRGETIELMGKIADRGTYVIASANAPREAVRRADLLVPFLSFVPGDTMDLHSGWSEESCECTATIVAGTMRGSMTSDDQSSDRERQARMVEEKVGRLYGMSDDLLPGYVVDAIGEVDWEEDEEEEPKLSASLQRTQAYCDGDSNELDEFTPDRERDWSESDVARTDSLGNHSARCRKSNYDLVLSEYSDGEEDLDAVEIHNPTPADIDLGKGGYVLEVYAPNESTPDRIIRLDGLLTSSGTFVLADEELAEELDGRADMSVDDLTLEKTSAVVLKKLIVPGNLQCNTPIALALDEFEPGVVLFVTDPLEPGTQPPGEPPIRVNPIASPN